LLDSSSRNYCRLRSNYQLLKSTPSLQFVRKDHNTSKGPRRIAAFDGVGHQDGDEEEQDFGDFVKEICSIPGMGHRVMVIQPDIKRGPRSYKMSHRMLKLEETCALVRTLPNWRVVTKNVVRTDQDLKKGFFGRGNFEMLIGQIRGNSAISAVVLGIDRLNTGQLRVLQEAWGLPVFDRYTIVLQIFKEHAQSKEAKLQVALAEIPYIKFRLDLIHGSEDPNVDMFGDNMPRDKRNFMLRTRESKLRKELNKLHTSRQDIRRERQENNVPTVAVVGYTNSGKTTLIKALTDDMSMMPQNHLFATLDVTSHEGVLPSKMKVTYMDTVGFITDMPTTLLDAFRSTLEDAMSADVVLHLRDASHPDRRLQIVSVHETLRKMLSEEQIGRVIDVYNKVDLLEEEELNELDPGILPISAVTGQGFAELGQHLNKALIATSGQMEKTFKIPNSETMLAWLQKEAAVSEVKPDPTNSQFLLVHVLISKKAYGKFQSKFSRKK